MNRRKITALIICVSLALPIVLGIRIAHQPFLKRDFDAINNFFANRGIQFVALAEQKDGRIVYAGGEESARIWGIAVVRVIKDKKTQEIFIDSGFGTGGLASTIMPKDIRVNDVAVDNLGRVIVYGDYDGKKITVRYLEDGAPDVSFGNNNGILVN